jgi:hypothetical protein
MLFVVIIVLLLIGNWVLSHSLIFLPMDLAIYLGSLGWWILALASISFVAWCISDD